MVLGSYCRCCFCNNRRIDRSFCKSYESSLRRIQTYCCSLCSVSCNDFGYFNYCRICYSFSKGLRYYGNRFCIVFSLSDAVLSNTFFGRGKDKPIHLFINHFLYYAGQYLIAASVMFA